MRAQARPAMSFLWTNRRCIEINPALLKPTLDGVYRTLHRKTGSLREPLAGSQRRGIFDQCIFLKVLSEALSK